MVAGKIYNPNTKRWIADTTANRKRLGKPLKTSRRSSRKVSRKKVAKNPPRKTAKNGLQRQYSELEKSIGIRKYTRSCSLDKKCKNNFNQKMGVYVINCAIHKIRLKKFLEYSRNAGIDICREICINGKRLTAPLLCKMINKGLLSPRADLTPIEVAIYLSHYNAWVRILKSCEEYGIVFEDDVKVKPFIVKRVNTILSKLAAKNVDFSILWLYNGNWMSTAKYRRKVLNVGNIEIKEEKLNYNAAASAYIISASFAKYLVKNAFPIKYQVDIMIGDNIDIGRHLTLHMKYDRKQQCYISPLLDLECGGEHGTGVSTQDYSAATVKEIRKSC